MTDRERVLVNKVCDLSIEAIDKITQLKQENSKLEKRVSELENTSKKKRKLRAMTVREHCYKVGYLECKKCPYCYDEIFCDYMKFNEIVKDMSVAPYKTKNGKYIFIEVKE